MENGETKSRFGLKTKISLALISSLLTLLVLGAIGEAMVRVRETRRDTPPGTMPLVFYRHNRLIHALVRNYDYFGWVHINEGGFRGASLAEFSADEGALRIMAVGGSTTFDSQVTGDDRAWPARLEHWLGKDPSLPRVHVVNAGTPGYRVVDNSIRFLTELGQYCPDVIILYHTHNDLIKAFRTADPPARGRPLSAAATPNEIQPLAPWSYWLRRHSLLYAKLLARIKVMQRQATRGKRAAASTDGARSAEEFWGERIERGAGQFESDLRAFLALAQTAGVVVIVPEVTIMGLIASDSASVEARVVSNFFSVPAEMVWEGYRSYAAVAQREAERFGAIFITSDSFGLDSAGSYAELDAIHFNDVGSDRFGARLAAAIGDTLVSLTKSGPDAESFRRATGSDLNVGPEDFEESSQNRIGFRESDNGQRPSLTARSVCGA